MTPDVLVVGHIAKDLTRDGWRPGGSVLYAARQCIALGLNVAVVTASGPEIEPAALVPEAEWLVLPDERTTTFENTIREGRRNQRVLERARRLTIEDLPDSWQGAPIVLLMPIIDDLEAGMVQAFGCSATQLGITLQGWLRELDITNSVKPGKTLDSRSLQGIDVAFVSEEDVQDEETPERWAQDLPYVVLTRGRAGTTVWADAERHDLASYHVEEVDPTGAGDVFAAAFSVKLHASGDAFAAGRFASAAAALSVQGIGIDAIGDREAIESLMRQGEHSRR